MMDSSPPPPLLIEHSVLLGLTVNYISLGVVTVRVVFHKFDMDEILAS